MSAPSANSSRCRPRRWLLAGGVGLVLGVVGLAALLAVPTVQRLMIARLVAAQPGWRLEARHLGVGPRGLALDGLDFVMPGLRAQSQPVAVRLAPVRLFRREVHVERVEARQLRLQIDPAAMEASGEPFAGLLGELERALPFRWSLQEADVQAEVTLEDAGEAVVVGDLQVRGGGVGAGRTGQFDYELDAASMLLPEGGQRVRSRGVLRVTQDAANRIERVELEGDLRLPVYGPLTLPAGALKVVVQATEAGESYAVTLNLGAGASLGYRGALDRRVHRLEGRWEVKVNEGVAAHLAGAPAVPRGWLEAVADVALDVRTYEFTAQTTGRAEGAEWARLAPILAGVGPLGARFEARVATGEAGLRLESAEAVVTDNAGFTLQAEWGKPRALGERLVGALATVRFEGLPLAWANAALEPELAFAAGKMAGAWRLVGLANGGLALAPVEPLAVPEGRLVGKDLPELPAGSLRAAPRIELTDTGVTLRCPDLEFATPAGDRLGVDLTAAYTVADARWRAWGRAEGEWPTLLAGPERALPFAVTATWDVAMTAEAWRADALEVVMRRPGDGHPYLALALPGAVEVKRVDGWAVGGGVAGELVRLEVKALPLDWLSRWRREETIAGVWQDGRSVVRAAAEGRGLQLATVVPWTFRGLSYGVGGKELIALDARVAPTGSAGPEGFAATVDLQQLADGRGNTARGAATFRSDWAAAGFGAQLELEADLPALPHSAGTFGPLRASLRAGTATMQERIGQVDTLELAVRRGPEELVRVEATEPFLWARKPNGEVIFQTAAPLRVRLAPLPLAWTKPWWPEGVTLEGTLEPGDFRLALEPQTFRLRATEPFRVRDFGWTQAGRPGVSAAALELFAGADLTLIHRLRPDFQLVYQGTAHTTGGVIKLGVEEAGAFDVSLGFMGNDVTVLPRSIEAQVRLELGRLHGVPALAAAGMPASGRWVARLNGDLLGREPLDFWSRLDGLPDATDAQGGKQSRPVLEVAARGKADGGATRFDFDVAARLIDAEGRESDLAFQVTALPGDAVLSFDSALRSRELDLGAARSLGEAFRAPERRDGSELEERPGKVAPAQDRADTGGHSEALAADGGALGAPFWAALRGRFDLDLGVVRHAPYEVRGLRGRLEVTERAVTLGGLEGEMFAGRWSGGLEVAFDPTVPRDRYQARGGFRISGAETARAVQTVFPNEFGSLEARVDLDARLRSDGADLFALLERAEADFVLESGGGVLRLTHPDAGTASTLLVLGGAVSFSPELRALGRLLRKFAEMPVERVRVSGGRDAAGNIVLEEFTVDSAQARLRGRGAVPVVEGVPLMGRRLDLALELQARDEVALILDRMKLLEKRRGADGFQRMTKPVEVRGEVGKPDAGPLYDLLARAVAGSRGTWGFIMRKVQAQVAKERKT